MVKTVTNRKIKNKEQKITHKIKKIKKDTTITDVKRDGLTKEQMELKKQLQSVYRVECLNYKELRVLDCTLKNESKKELAEELGCSVSVLYWITCKQEFQKVFQRELKELYLEMKDTRKAMYMKIAEKSLNILLSRLDKIEQLDNGKKGDQSWEKTRDILAIVDKIVMLMQEEDGTKRMGLDISGGMNNTNVNVSDTIKEFDMADVDFRKNMANFLVKSKGSADITRVVE